MTLLILSTITRADSVIKNQHSNMYFKNNFETSNESNQIKDSPYVYDFFEKKEQLNQERLNQERLNQERQVTYLNQKNINTPSTNKENRHPNDVQKPYMNQIGNNKSFQEFQNHPETYNIGFYGNSNGESIVCNTINNTTNCQ